MRSIVFLVLIQLPWQLYAQCHKYDNAMRMGEEYLYQKEPDFDKALIEFQIAQIAARECRLPGDKSERARRKIDSVFIGLKLRRDQALAAKQRAEIADFETKKALKAEKKSRATAIAEQKKSDSLRKEAEKQKEQADLFASEVEKEKNLNSSLNMALQSTLTEDSLIKTKNAVEAYHSNRKYNDGKWMPEITRALLGSIPGNSIRSLLKFHSGIIDIFRIGGAIYLVTDSGELRKFEKGMGYKLWSDQRFYYVNNSWVFDSVTNRLSLMSKNNLVFLFDMSSDTIRFAGTASIEKGRFPLASQDCRLYPEGIYKISSDSIEQKFLFPARPLASAFAVSPGRNIMAVGTGEGWLEVFEEVSNPVFSGQFQLEHTRINDIGFDGNNEFIATAGNDGHLRLNKVEYILTRAPIDLNIGSWVNAILFLDSKEMLIGTRDGSLYHLNYDQEKLAEQCRRMLEKTRGNIKYRK
jgi:hypothetical protein